MVTKTKTHKTKKHIPVVCFTFAFFLGIGSTVSADVNKTPIKERQVVEINESLKNVIEENQRLASKNQKLEQEITRLKTESSDQKGKIAKIKREHDTLNSKIRKIKTDNKRYATEIKELESSVEDLQLAKAEYSKKNSELERKLARSSRSQDSAPETMVLAKASKKEIQKREEQTLDLLLQIDAFAEEDERLRMDAAKAHYNMGNIYYQKGEYEIASREYHQAVTLMPDDPDSHYNLAFVSGEHLDDFKTALKHYKMYLYLNPKAKDIHLVNQKIVEAQLQIKSTVNSPLEKKKK